MKGNLKYIIIIIISLLVLAFVAVVKVVPKNKNKQTRIVSDSMYPTLLVEDKLSVEDYTNETEIKRGDIVIINLNVLKHYPKFKFDENCRMQLDIKNKCYNAENVLYVKRVLGLPNENVKIRKNKVYINGKEIKQTETEVSEKIKNYGEKYLSTFNLKGEFKFFKENNYIIADSVRYEKYSKNLLESVKLKNDEYFLMGDNRDFSDDSRSIGVVKKKDIVYIEKK